MLDHLLFYPLSQVQQLVSVWLEWAEMEIRNQQLDSALEVMRRATVIPKGRVFYGAEEDTSVAVQERLHKVFGSQQINS